MMTSRVDSGVIDVGDDDVTMAWLTNLTFPCMGAFINDVTIDKDQLQK